MRSTKDFIMATVLTLAAVGQIVLAFLLYNKDGNEAIINMGWMILSISAIFGWLPIFTFKKWGEVSKGKGYMHTTVLVDRGVYAIVRHPQYLAGILMGLALPLISQHWVVAALGILVIVITYLNTYDEEVSTIAKFGDEYRQYMRRVPRVNFLLGIIRLLRRKRTSDSKQT
jgi:protein-S-isoprenylcysteine O-methyltransferase Ste14